VRVSCRVWDQYGEFVYKAHVRFEWRLPSGRLVRVAHTDLSALAHSRLTVPTLRSGERVVVYVRVLYKNAWRSRGIAFWAA
jgi:hypothetical protein